LTVSATPSLYHRYWRFSPVAVTERLKLSPLATLEMDCGWTVIEGLLTLPPLLLEEDDEDELEEELDEDELPDPPELLDELLEAPELEPELLAPEDELEELPEDELLDDGLELAPPAPTARIRKVLPVLLLFLVLSNWTWRVWVPEASGLPRLSGSIMR